MKKITHQASFTRRTDGLEFTVELTIDIDEIAQTLAARAINSKSGTAQALRGDIKCNVVARSDKEAKGV